MKKLLCHLFALSFLIIHGNASAQTDSAYFDLGRIKMRKDFTQHITIKGSDLEYMPFARISDALAPWLHGTLSTRPNLVFVVDGNLVNDVNAWSIYDIEDITLVQNALVQVNGSLNNQQLVLVRTKRNQSSPKGLTVAGSSYLTNLNLQSSGDDLKSEKNFYHQYHVGAWQERGRISLGASANWLRDVFPQVKDWYETHTPRQLNRFRFNGWANATLAEGHTLALRLNVAPQTIKYDITGLPNPLFVQHDEATLKSTAINPSLHLSNRIGKNWLHELDLSYFTNRAPQDTRTATDYLPPASGIFELKTHTLSKYRNILVRDRIGYTHTMGQWQLQPVVSFSYRSVKQEVDYRHTSWNNGVLNSTTIGEATFKSESWVLTPAINLSYGNVFSIAGGISAKLKEDNTIFEDRVYPFVTTMIDVLRIGNPNNASSLKLFGSFAKPGDFADTRFQQPDLQYDADPYFASFQGPIYGGNVLFTPYPEDPTIQSIQAGAVFSLPGDKLQVSYNYDNRKYLGQLLAPLPIGSGYDYAIYHPNYVYSTHRLAILKRVITKDELRWLPGFNITGLKYKIEDEDDYPTWSGTADANNEKMVWTGGFINRLQYRKFSFGLDILYQLNKQLYYGPVDGYDGANTFRISSVYAGYSFKIANRKPLEIYLSGRNLLESRKSGFFDNRRYYGAGFKLAI